MLWVRLRVHPHSKRIPVVVVAKLVHQIMCRIPAWQPVKCFWLYKTIFKFQSSKIRLLWLCQQFEYKACLSKGFVKHFVKPTILISCKASGVWLCNWVRLVNWCELYMPNGCCNFRIVPIYHLGPGTGNSKATLGCGPMIVKQCMLKWRSDRGSRGSPIKI